jgi:CRISPR system Cascade subunit CasE
LAALESIADAAARRWLLGQAPRRGFSLFDKPAHESGFDVIAYHRHNILQRTQRGIDTKPITFGSLEYNGSLTVTDTALFWHTLSKGLGSARGFGFGLMQIALA